MLGDSDISGVGLFAKQFIPSESEFISNLVGEVDVDGEYHDYYWNGGFIFGGIGYYCNGTCMLFDELKPGTTVGTFKFFPKNVRRVKTKNDIKNGFTVFKTTSDILAGQELILEYGSRYFISRLK
jgi:hypothetical protein